MLQEITLIVNHLIPETPDFLKKQLTNPCPVKILVTLILRFCGQVDISTWICGQPRHI